MIHVFYHNKKLENKSSVAPAKIVYVQQQITRHTSEYFSSCQCIFNFYHYSSPVENVTSQLNFIKHYLISKISQEKS